MSPWYRRTLLLGAVIWATPTSAQSPVKAPRAIVGCPAPVDHSTHATMDHAAHAPTMAAGGLAGVKRDSVSPRADSSFSALQARGLIAMGVDQYTSTHHFETLRDGGRIELQRDVDDSAGTAQIRAHLCGIAAAFASGDFSTPAFVHMQTVPGATVMAAKRDLITYVVRPLPRGGELRITTGDPEALAAVASFLAFQRMDHRAH
jgi:hypothetical protein